jgi:hypothetical protein
MEPWGTNPLEAETPIGKIEEWKNREVEALEIAKKRFDKAKKEHNHLEQKMWRIKVIEFSQNEYILKKVLMILKGEIFLLLLASSGLLPGCS